MFVEEKKKMPGKFIFCVLEELNALKCCKGEIFGKEN